MAGNTILDLCGGSGAWSRPYKEAGYNVVPVTLPEYDVRLWPAETVWGRIEDLVVHGILAAPPCTVFANSGNRHRRSREEIIEGLSVVDACLRIIAATRPEWWALENPIGKLRRWLGKPTYSFDPYHHGDPWSKGTHLWGDFTIPRRNVVTPGFGSIAHTGRRYARSRAKTPPGFARAFFEANP